LGTPNHHTASLCVRQWQDDAVTTHPVVDGHNDLPWAMRGVGYDFDQVDIDQPQPHLHTDLGRMRAGRVGAQFWSVYVPCNFVGQAAVQATLEQIDAVYTMIERYADRLILVTAADGLDDTLRSASTIGSLLGAEGGHCIDNSLAVLRIFYRLGVRYLTLTHNENTAWADSATDTAAAGGLTAFGREIVAEMNRLGMLVDLSHTSVETMQHALDATKITISLADTEGLWFEVRDDGAGCDVEASGDGAGLTNMRDRLAALGGDLLIWSVPGEGVIVSGSLPER